MMTHSSPSARTRFPAASKLASLVALGALAVLGAALWEQSLGNAPCPLCILQRIGYIGLLVFAVTGIALRAAGAGACVARGAWVLGVLSGLGGLAVAAKHVWLVWHPLQTCGLDPLAVKINAWSITQALPWLLSADGLCSDVPSMLGVSLPTWSALGFVVLTLLLVAAMRRRDAKTAQA